jgi:hypothetical protein
MKAQVRSGIFLAIMVMLVMSGGVALAKPVEDTADLAAPAAPPLSHYIRIEEASVDTLSPAVAYNSLRHEFLVVWEQHIHGGEVAIFGRRVSVGGETIGPAFPVRHVANLQFYRPDVAYSPKQDKYLVVYHHKVTTDNYDVWGIPVSGGGAPGVPFPIDEDLDRDWYPAIAYNGQVDEFLVVLEKYVSAARRDIEAHRIRAADWTEPANGWRNLAGAANQARRLPDVAYNAARNEYLIGYILNSPPTAGGDLVGLIANSNLGTLSSEMQLTPMGFPSQTGIALAAGPDEYLCVFDEDHGGSSYQVWARRIRGDGTMDTFINLNPTGVSRLEPAVGFGAGGHYLVALRRVTSASNWDVFGQFIRTLPDTPLEGTEFGIHDVTGHQLVPAVACSPSGPCLVVNEENQNLGGGGIYDLWGRLVGDYHRVFLPLILDH